jgi:hypothetical protein
MRTIALIVAVLAAKAVSQSNGIHISWQQPEPQPYYYVIERMPSGKGFPKQVEPSYGVGESWTDVSAKPGMRYRYRVCSAYSPDGAQLSCTNWFSAGSDDSVSQRSPHR